MSYPYLARTTLKYKSPHATDLSFAKDETIRVTGPSDDDEDWLVGETLDGSRSGGFPKDFIVQIEEDAAEGAGTDDAQAEATSPQEPPAPAATATSPVSPTVAKPTLPAIAPAATFAPSATSASEKPSPVSPTKPKAPSTDTEDPSALSLKDRLALFNAAPGKSAPPPIKPKPAGGGLTWSQRQKLREEQEAKEKAEAGDTAGAAPVSAEADKPKPVVESTPSSDDAPSGVAGRKEGTGMSASDAQSSITKGGSLKERMAALQGAGAFGAGQADKPAPPKPSGKVWSRPAAPEAAEEVEEPEAEGTAEEGGDEEDEEKARRAAIAERMAKLGARGPMGMPPPKPTRKPTIDRSAEEAKPTDSAAAQEEPAPAATIPEDASKVESEAPKEDKAPESIAMPAIPRRTAGPRRPGRPAAARANTDEIDKRVEKVNEDGTISPPPAVMVHDEERPLEKTDEQLEEEAKQEEAGQGERGEEGARAAGIALSPVPPHKNLDDEAGDADGQSESEEAPPPPRRLPVPPKMPAQASESDEEEKDSAPPPPRRLPVPPAGPPRPDDSDDESAEDVPPPPPRVLPPRPSQSMEKEKESLPPRPLPIPPTAAAAEEDEDEDDEAPPPPPPTRPPVPTALPPRPETEDSEDEDDAAPPPPPNRPPVPSSLPPRPTDEDSDAPPPPPTRPPVPSVNTAMPSNPPEPSASQRSPRSPISSPRMQMPPTPTSPTVSRREVPPSPGGAGVARKLLQLDMGPPMASPTSPPLASTDEQIGGEDDDETPEQAAERKRKILARMRAGGTLGFGMFNHGPPPAEWEEPKEMEAAPESPTSPMREDRDQVPAVPPGRPNMPPPPASTQYDDDEGPPPPPPNRPSISQSPTETGVPRPPIPSSRPSLPPPPPAEGEDMEDAPLPPARPAVPANRPSLPPPPPPVEEEEEAEDQVPPPPSRPAPLDTQYAAESDNAPPRPDLPPPPSPGGPVRRSMSVLSQTSSKSKIDSPIRRSMTASRPGYNELAAASQQIGSRVLKAAHNVAQHAKKQQIGDGSAPAFVMAALEQAQVQVGDSWGQLIFEQEAGSVLKKLDEPRPGDIVALYDARFKGKKGLSSYTQHVGSVEEPLVGIISEVEQKKHKLRVLQVERGVSDEVSYRCDDLKSGKVMVHRAGV